MSDDAYREFTDPGKASELSVAVVWHNGHERLRWMCPACKHECDREPPGGGTVAALDDQPLGDDEPAGEWVTLRCVCQEEHPGRPTDKRGCGFYADQLFA